MSAVAAPPHTPSRSLDQRMDALVNANHIRSTRAVLKRDLKAGRITASSILRRQDVAEGPYATMKVFDLMLALPKLGRVKVNKIIVHCRISPSKTIGGMSERQRNEIVIELHGR